MPNSEEQLRNVNSFENLIHYLEEKLDWPLQEYGFDELTFEYQPSELGLKEEEAAKVKNIHQLRPLQSGQPWGIFFVEFENKKLPVVVLRRILSHLAIKKRASANKAREAAWHADDLMFITTFGEDDSTQREIAFAHFHQSPGDLPTLRVLGWDGGDTPLKLAHVDYQLRQYLSWPDDPSNINNWREHWSKPFRHRIGHVIRTADSLAEVLAALARGIRDKAMKMISVESSNGPLRQLHKAFQTALIHDLTEESFADTYAQTITYGLLTAAISRTEGSEGRHGTFIIAENVTDMVPITNPFLKEMLQTFLKVGGRKGGIDFDELGIQDVVELLRGDETDLPAILLDFGNKTQGEDPVIHFYEHFLSAYNRKLKIQRGVFYTPQPAVSYIIHSVHELLQTEFGLEDGLASTVTWGEMITRHPDIGLPVLTPKNTAKSESKDILISPSTPFVMILDIATGTGTFLVEVIDIIFKTMKIKWQNEGKSNLEIANLWNEYVPKHLLPRLYGYELMMAPYAIAHMKIGLKLFETGYQFKSNERVRVYLTNTLEPPSDTQQQLAGILPALAHEAEAVNTVKRNVRFTVLLGNPPYSYMSANLTQTAAMLIEPFRFVDGERIRERSALSLERSLQDDFVKFFGLARKLRKDSGSFFVLGLITNNSYMDSPLHRGVRGELVSVFDQIFITNLFGDSIKDHEENIFDILQGVAIFLGVGLSGHKNSQLFISDIHGDRKEKYAKLVNKSLKSTKFIEIKPIAPQRYFLVLEKGEEYSSFPILTEVFRITSTCIKTLKDYLSTDFEAEKVEEKIEYFRDQKTSKNDIKAFFGVEDVVQWKIEPACRAVRNLNLKDYITQYQARPFDYRWMFYHNAIIGSPRKEVMHNLLDSPNLALIANRKIRTGECHHFWVTSHICVSEVISSADNSNCFPLYIIDEEQGLKLEAGIQTNFSTKFLRQLSTVLALQQAPSNHLPLNIAPEDVFNYIYSIFYSPKYRSRYTSFLKIDFPRVPLTSSLELFRSLAKLGGRLVAMHLLVSPKVNDFITSFTGKGNNAIPKKPIWKNDAIWINATQRFEGVPENVWNFHIGGYQVCEKWLKDRKGRTLSNEDIKHYQRMVVAINETIYTMAKIDKVIDEYGGWPGAFYAGKSTTVDDDSRLNNVAKL